MKIREISHEGKVVFVGIDVHKKTYAISARGQHFPSVVRMGNLEANPTKLAKRLKQIFPGALIKSVYEAGFSGFVLHRTLVKEGIENIVVNPSSIEVAANDRVKTDKRDADKMSSHLSLGLLKDIRIPTEQEELARLYSRTRRQLVKHRSRTANQIKSKLRQFGRLDPHDDRVMSMSLLKEFQELELPQELKVTIDSLGSVYRGLSEEIDGLEIKMTEQAEVDHQNEAIYQSVPGLGDISARILANELGNMSQFPNQRALYRFTGLTPSEYSSGEKERKGHISRQGHSELRAVLVEASWRAIQKDPVLASVYEPIKARRGGKRAIVAVARRLIGRIRGCFQHGDIYKMGYGTEHVSIKLPRGRKGVAQAKCKDRLVTLSAAHTI